MIKSVLPRLWLYCSYHRLIYEDIIEYLTRNKTRILGVHGLSQEKFYLIYQVVSH